MDKEVEPLVNDCRTNFHSPLAEWAVNGEVFMRVQNYFCAAQEGMCLERASVAKKEMDYWNSEAAEWKKLRESSTPSLPFSSTGVPSLTGTKFQGCG